ncbi:signal peptidase I [Ameyamaea chiangmaiensis NBRC 103196]|uniref:Signal peptidase I n=1 Tax=Ameyamaea chiangmaiensis TaxID=442969 RepID=A0A850PC46_9PROT|nr:signal peptidase I [Ameyamaea chiangmaiensis]MBS4074411.1 signal peptidase I [Ameyamaea chiangmaiensis]NVN40483.1 signal peptidase I [Ameyamaea chiangmaiensis]GBQ71931.1 signal peptidase I [Ameyamaea chiangmaiensis NBRC 103196]
MAKSDRSPSATAPSGGLSLHAAWEWLRTVGVALIFAVGVRTVLFEPFSIPSGSMIPTLQVGDYLFVAKYSYGYSHFALPFSPDLFSGRVLGREPHRGDVAVFRFTKDTSIDYIKRIVGLPGDHVQVRAGQLYLNGTLVPRTSLGDYVAVDEHRTQMEGERFAEDLPGSGGRGVVKHDILKLTDEGMQNDTPDYVVPAGYFFAMGDNRDDSADSRFMGSDPEDLGFVPMENLVGQAKWIFFSIDAAHPFWQVWEWPLEIRWSRLFHGIR